MAAKGSAMKWMVVLAAFLGMAMCGLLMLVVIGGATGIPGLLVGMILATLPVPLYVMLALWVDRNEKEPAWMLAMAFFWGATGACLISIIFNDVNGLIFAALLGPETASVAGAVLSAPFVEELAKGIVLFLLYFWKKDEFDNVTDGIVYAAMVGLGFAMTENVLYYGRAMMAGGVGGSLFLFALRGMMGPFAHPLFTSMTGIGLGIARETNRKALKVAAPIVGLGMAMFIHFLWNLSASMGELAYYGTYLLIMVPALLSVVGLVLYSLARERKIIRAHLTPYVQTGVLAQADLDALCRMGGRLRALMAAMKAEGARGWMKEGQFHQAASELAFHRWRTQRGISRGGETDAAQESEYLERLRTLRARPAVA